MLGGVKMPSTTRLLKKLKGHPFQPPSNVDLPAAVGKYLQYKSSFLLRE